jgi:hypothetical protein
MTGWDTPSRPTWDPQDGPDDGTQASSVQGPAAGDGDPWAVPSGSGWDAPGGEGDAFSGPPPEFFAPQEFEQRTPGASLGRAAEMPSWDLPVRDTAGRGPTGAGTPAWDQAPAWDEPHWPDAARQDFGGQDLPRRDSGRLDPGGPGFGAQGEYGRQDQSRQDFTRQDLPRQDFTRQDLTRLELPRSDAGAELAYGRPGLPRRDLDGPDPAAQAGGYAVPGHPTEPEQPDQDIPLSVRLERERAARMDPALQDFFGPTSPGPGYGPPYGQGPRGAQAAAGRLVDPWDDRADRADWAARQPPAPPLRPNGLGPNGPGPNGGPPPRRSSGGRASRVLAVCAVVVVVVAVGGYLLLHKSNSSNAANGTTPTVAPSSSATAATKAAQAAKTPTSTASAHSRVSGNAATEGYVLATPSVAGGYPIGSDPDFLATATSTATAIEQSAIGNKGGTVTGKPVSASYTLPAEQTIEFVGYQGTFNPKTVMNNLGSFGTDEGTYPAGAHGGEMACANVPSPTTADSGGVCVWVTATTLGITEFFDSSGPEVLTVAQAKGAEDTVALRASVETRKS